MGRLHGLKKTNDMTKMDKNNLYDEMCHLLTDYEQAVNEANGELDESEAIAWEENFYTMLVKIQNNWEELTGEDE